MLSIKTSHFRPRNTNDVIIIVVTFNYSIASVSGIIDKTTVTTTTTTTTARPHVVFDSNFYGVSVHETRFSFFSFQRTLKIFFYIIIIIIIIIISPKRFHSYVEREANK